MLQTTRSVSFGGKNTPEVPAFSGRTYILTIGIDQYSGLPKLRNAVKDARDVTALLTSKYQFEADHVITLFDADATQGNIYKALNSLIDVVKPEDVVLIYFAGHGILQNNIKEGYWIPVDGERNNYGTFIANSLITKYLKSINSLHTLVVADACFAGAMFEERDVPDISLQRQEKLNSRWLLTSCRDSTSIDAVDSVTNSPFADSLLLHLKSNEKDALPVTALARSIIYDLGNNYEQLPRCAPLYGVGDRGGEFVFRLKGSKRPDKDENPVPKPPSAPEVFKEPGSALRRRIIQWLLGALIIFASVAVSVQLFGPKGSKKTRLAASQGRMDLSAIYEGQKDTFSFTVVNTGDMKALVDDIGSVNKTFRVLNKVSVEIAAKGSHTYQAEWTGGGTPFTGLVTDTILVSGSNVEEPLQISLRRQVTSKIAEHNDYANVTDPKNDPVEPQQKARLIASPKIIDLQEITKGTQKAFSFTLHNTGAVNTRMLSATISNPEVTLTNNSVLNLIQANKTVTCSGVWKPARTGAQTCTLRIGGNNMEQAVEVILKANVKAAATTVADPPVSKCKVTCRAPGKTGIAITLVDPETNREYSATTNAAGEADFQVPCDLMSQTVKVYVRMPNGTSDNFNVSLQRFITIPD